MAKQSLTTLGTMGGEPLRGLAESESSSATLVREVLHELGPHLEDGTQEIIVAVNQITPPKSIIFKSHVVAGGARSLRSPQYLETVRRREAGRIAEIVAALAQHASGDRFSVWTQEPLERIRRLIQQLSHAEEYSAPEHEGNSCEILRQLRDTFLDDGWQEYRKAAVRDGAIKVLRRLATAEEVTPEDAFHSMDELLELELKPVVGMAWSDEDENGLPR